MFRNWFKALIWFSLNSFVFFFQGASTTVWAAVAPELENNGGLYLENCRIGIEKASLEEVQSNYEGFYKLMNIVWFFGGNFFFFKGYLAHARDPESAEKLWKLTEELIASKN